MLNHQVQLPLQILHLSLHRGDHVDLHLCALDVSRVAALLHAGLELGDDLFDEAALAAAAGNNRNIRQRRLGAAAARRVLVDGAELAIWEAARVRITESAPPEDSLLRLEGELFSENAATAGFGEQVRHVVLLRGNWLTTGIVIVGACWCQVGNRKMPILDPSQ